MKATLQRRTFIKRMGAACAAATLPTFHIARGAIPGDLLRLGAIGAGRMGMADIKSALYNGLKRNIRLVAVCDVDQHRARAAREEIERIYAAEAGGEKGEPVNLYGDYRELLAREDIDGVTITTPDHAHAPIAIAAAQAGKDIHIQKPLTYSIPEGRALVKAVRSNGVVLQTGSQQRSSAHFHKGCELVRRGRIGALKEIRVSFLPDQGTGNATPMEVPEHLDYQAWLGQAPTAPYTEDRVHPQEGYGRPGWLQIEPYCRGMITGWGSHMNDIAQWGHGSDHTGPVEMKATAAFPDRGLFNVHTEFHAEGRYADGVKLVQETGPAGVKFIGEEGWIWTARGQLDAENKALLQERIPAEEAILPVSVNHMGNFLDCMRTREDPIAPVEVGHRSNSICVITHIAMKLDRTLRWDPRNERFLGDAEANALLPYPGQG
jgi:predicted dehydrogenase